ncbi:MAG: GNAT family N-acetyltransferase [Actinomycetales bacterium]
MNQRTTAVAGPPALEAVSRRPSVLFVCVHNAGRSQMAMAWVRHLTGERVDVRSAGSEPAASVHPAVVGVMREVGIDVATAAPRLLTPDDVRRADVVVTMGCDDTCPVFPGIRYQDWDLADPAGRSEAEVRPIRDEIRRRVEQLLADLVVVEPLREAHWADVARIFAAGIAGGDATFETTVPSWTTWDADHLAAHRYVATDGTGTVTGWVAAVPVSGRCVYAGVVEHSVYVDPARQGNGIGRRLLETLVASTEAAGIWTIQSGVFPENVASLALHERLGFRVVGTRERLGRSADGRWRDVVLLERRSPAIH